MRSSNVLKRLGRSMPKCSQELPLGGEFQAILISSSLFIFSAFQTAYEDYIVEGKENKFKKEM